MRVAFQGEPGAYSEEALLAAVPDARSVPAPLLRDVFEILARGDADLAIVPCENSQAGSITEAYDLLLEYADTLHIRGEQELRVRHCLLTNRGTSIDRVETAFSHPQALAQTVQWLRSHNIKTAAFHDTAGAARWVAEKGDHTQAAVASKRAAEVYGLQILAEGIEDNPTNRTRFLIVGHEPSRRTETEGKTSLVFSTANEPGALYRALRGLAERDVNLLKLESRPSRGEGWEYTFYMDCSGWVSDPQLMAALNAVREETSWLRVLGSYPRSV